MNIKKYYLFIVLLIFGIVSTSYCEEKDLRAKEEFFKQKNIAGNIDRGYDCYKEKHPSFDKIHKIINEYIPDWKIHIHYNSVNHAWEEVLFSTPIVKNTKMAFGEFPVVLSNDDKKNRIIHAKIIDTYHEENLYIINPGGGWNYNSIQGEEAIASIAPELISENNLSYDETCQMIGQILLIKSFETVSGGSKAIAIIKVNAIIPDKNQEYERYKGYILTHPEEFPLWEYCVIEE